MHGGPLLTKFYRGGAETHTLRCFWETGTLPLELRQQIYADIFDPAAGISCSSSGITWTGWSDRSPSPTCLLPVCRQLYVDIIPRLYRTLYIRQPDVQVFKKFIDTIGPINRMYICCRLNNLEHAKSPVSQVAGGITHVGYQSMLPITWSPACLGKTTRLLGLPRARHIVQRLRLLTHDTTVSFTPANTICSALNIR